MRGAAPLAGALALLPLVLQLPPLEGQLPERALQASDTLLQGQLVRLRGRRPAPADPIVLAIDSDSIDLARVLPPEERQRFPLRRRMGAWPWSRDLQAALAEHLLRSGARQVVFNVVHAQPSALGPDDDRAFSRRLAPFRDRVVLAAALVEHDGGDGLSTRTLLGPGNTFAGGGFRRVGLTNLLQSPQGVAEAIPGRRWLEASLGEIAADPPPPLALAASGRPLQAGPLLIDPLPPESSPPLLPAWQLEDTPASLWRGRSVLIGVTAAGLGDRLESPFGARSGVELQAQALATLNADRARRTLSPGPTALLLALWAAVVALALARGRSSLTLLLIGLLLVLLSLATSALAWERLALRLPATALALAPMLASLGVAAPRWRRESRERAVLHRALARRLSPVLLNDLLRQPAPAGDRLGGRRCRCIVLFADLEGFTGLSHRLETGELFSLLNAWFAAVGRPILDEGGLLDKFIGDAVMAEFGLPASRGERQEALAAARAALRMQDALAAFNATRTAAGAEPLRMGIALHAGEVMAGNLGLPERLEYTAIGSAVNMASRLEGLTRRFPDHPVLISGELLALIADRAEVVSLGQHALRGWPEPVEVHGLHGLRS